MAYHAGNPKLVHPDVLRSKLRSKEIKQNENENLIKLLETWYAVQLLEWHDKNYLDNSDYQAKRRKELAENLYITIKKDYGMV